MSDLTTLPKTEKVRTFKKVMPFLIASAFFIFLMSSAVFGQTSGHEGHEEGSGLSDFSLWFGVLELPFLFLCVYFAFQTALALRGGVFGQGMNLMAWGFLVMAVGHLNMQLDHFFQINIFNDLLGADMGKIVWFVALVGTWSLSGLGFYKIYRAASKGE